MANADLVERVREIDARLRELSAALRATRLTYRPAGTRVRQEAVRVEAALQRAEPPLIFLRVALEDEDERDVLVDRLAELDARTQRAP